MVNHPTLSPKCQQYLDRFVSQANKRSPFPDDWLLFFDFVHICHNETWGYCAEHLLPAGHEATEA